MSTVMLTGAAGNLGRAVASAFAETGANLVLLDLNASHRITEDLFRSRSVNSWLLGQTVKGRVRATIAAGRLAFAG